MNLERGLNVSISDLNVRFSTGGEIELQEAITLYGQALTRYCHNILCDYHEAEDVVQITFVKAYEKRAKFEAGTSLSSWLYRIAYTTCMDVIRKRKWLFFMPSQQSQQESFMSEELKEALSTLSVMERALIFGRIIEERDYQELEEIYQIPSATLRKRYERARKKLSNQLCDQYLTPKGSVMIDEI